MNNTPAICYSVPCDESALSLCMRLKWLFPKEYWHDLLRACRIASADREREPRQTFSIAGIHVELAFMDTDTPKHLRCR